MYTELSFCSFDMELVSVEDNFNPVRVNDFIQVVVINLWMRLTK
jgi:hypothetical protein